LSNTKSSVSVIADTKAFFFKSLQEALFERKIETYPAVEMYLVDVLEKYMLTDNLYNEAQSSGKKTRETLAETLLKASNASPRMRVDLLRRLGDSALYISGFFGASLQRKVVDIDYYIDMGSTAYGSLAKEIEEDVFAKTYQEIASKFTGFVDVFTLMSKRSMSQNSADVFRLIDVYSKTGSALALDQLTEQGIFPDVHQLKKCKNQ
jgi:hypothetical protein